MNARQRRGLLLLVLAAVLGLTAFVVVSGYVGQVRAQVGPTVTVYRLDHDVDAFATLTAADARPVEIPRTYVGPDLFTDKEFVGRKALVKLSGGAYLSQTMLVPATDLNPGEREIAINVDAETGVAGRIEPGDYVNVNVTFDQKDPELQVATVLIRRARIVSIGARRDDRSGEGVQTVVPVTFALSEQNSLKLLYAESFAKSIRLSKVRPDDTSPPEDSTPYTSKDVRGLVGSAK